MHTVRIHPLPYLQVISRPKMGKTGVKIVMQKSIVTSKNPNGLHFPRNHGGQLSESDRDLEDSGGTFGTALKRRFQI